MPTRHAVPLTHPADLAAETVYTYDEVAAMLKCSKRTVEQLVHDGKLRPVVFYRSVRFTPRALREFLDRHEHRIRRVSPPQA